MNFPILLEVSGDDSTCEEPISTQLYHLRYQQGPCLEEDRLDMQWRPLFDSGTCEDVEATWTPHGSVAFIWSRKGPRRLWTLSPDDERPRQLLAQLVRKARFSPLGDEIAYLAPDRARGVNWEWGLWLCRPDGTQGRLLETPDLPVQHLEYSPDGAYLWFTLWSFPRPEHRGLYCYHRSTGRIEHEARGEYADFSLSPCGERMVFVGNRGESALCLRELSSGRERVVRWLGQERQYWGESSLLSPVYSPDGSRILYGVHHQGEDWSVSQLCVTTEDGSEARVLWEEEGVLRAVPYCLAA